jgi:hypothetical protein
MGIRLDQLSGIRFTEIKGRIMIEMKIVHKHSNGSDKKVTVADLDYGQLAINSYTGEIQIKTIDGVGDDEIRSITPGHKIFEVTDISERDDLVSNREILPMQFCRYQNSSGDTVLDVWVNSNIGWKTIEIT